MKSRTSKAKTKARRIRHHRSLVVRQRKPTNGWRFQPRVVIQHVGREFLVQFLAALALTILHRSVVEILLTLTIVQTYFRNLDRWLHDQ